MEREIKSDIFRRRAAGGRVINSQQHKFIAIYLFQKFANKQMRVHFGCITKSGTCNEIFEWCVGGSKR